MSCLKKFIKNFTLRSDLFAAPATLRYAGETTYESYCGGILSISLVIAFAVIFYSSFVDVLTKVIINASTDVQTDPYNSLRISDFQFAVGIQGLDFGQSQRYFQIVVTHQSRPLGESPTHTIVQMEICNISRWENAGNHFDKLFEHHQMQKMLCPKQGEHIQLEGFAGSETWQFLEVKIQKCVNQTEKSWTCYPQADIDSFMDTYQTANDYFEVNVFAIDTLFSPQKQNYITKNLQEEIFLTFSSHTGSRGKIRVGDYNITTDHSIWPVTDETQEIGHYIVDYNTHTVDLFSTHYVKLTIQKDQTVYTLERVHGKLDQMLSYVGGLFSLLFAFIVFFIGSYSQYLYELGVAENAFVYDKSGKKVGEKNFNFFTFLKYAIYDWLTCFGCSISWKQMQIINSARQQANQQLDVRLIIKKLERFERINQLLLKQRNLICSHLIAPPTIDKIKRLRKITQYYDKVIKNDENLNLAHIAPQIDRLDGKQVSEQSYDSFNKSDTLEDVPSDFDSEDEQIEKQILQAYQNLKQDKTDKMGSEILESIPRRMKKRLHYVKGRQANQDQNNKPQFYSVNNTKSDLEYIPKNKNSFIIKNIELQ